MTITDNPAGIPAPGDAASQERIFTLGSSQAAGEP